MSSATTIPSGVASDPPNRCGMPLVTAWLRRFQARQSWLLFLQGLAFGALALLAGVSLIMVLDAIGTVSDAWRWTLTICVEVSALAVAICFGLGKPWTRTPLRRVASDVEAVYPEVQEQLLACVELSEVRDNARNFSAEFLVVLQNRVAQLLRERSVVELLPWSTIRGPFLAALVSWLATVGLCIIPGLDMASRIQRALIPFADIERPSRTGIEVIQPSRKVAMVPENQAIELEIQISGTEVDQAWMEWRSRNTAPASERREKMVHIGRSPDRYAGSLRVESDEIEYRFHAGDGKTSWRVVRPVPRPRIARFKHRIHFPDYTGLEPSELISDRGSLTALTGSLVEVGIEPSIQLSSAVASIERLDTGEQESVSLEYSDQSSVWSFSRACDADSRYQLKLQANTPGGEGVIENTFRPTHELNTVADHPPVVEWMVTEKTIWDSQPQIEQAWIVSPKDMIFLAARVADDLPGTSIEQQISINRGPWMSVQSEMQPIATRIEAKEKSLPAWIAANAWIPIDGVANNTDAAWAWGWDLLTAGASSGDTIALRMSATDSYRQVSYSPVLEFSLASSGFDRNRHDALLARASLLPVLERLANVIHASKESLVAPLQQIRSGGMTPEERTKLANEIARAAEQWSEASKEVRVAAGRVIAQLPRPLDQSETEYVVRMVSKLDRDHATAWTAAIDFMAWDTSQQPKLVPRFQEGIDQAARALREADNHATRLVDLYRQFVGNETLTALTKDMLYLKQHEDEQIQRLDRTDFSMLARSQRIAVQYIDMIEQLAKQMEPSLSQHLRNGFRNWYRFLDQTRTELSHRIQQEPTSENFNALADEIKRTSGNLRHQHWAFQLDGGLWWNISDMRRDLMQRASGVHTPMSQAIERLQRDQAIIADRGISTEVAQLYRGLSIQSAANRSAAAVRQIADRRELQQVRVPSDPYFAGDMGLALRAWESQFKHWADAPSIDRDSNGQKEVLAEIVRAYRILEIAHDMNDIRTTAESLQRDEQYDWDSLEGKLSHVRIWDSLLHRIELVGVWMKESSFSPPLADAYLALCNNEPSNAIRRKMEPRRYANAENVVSVYSELDAWLAELRDVERATWPTIEEARRLLASMSPSLAELAQRAARETRVLQDRVHEPNGLDRQFEIAEQSLEQLQDSLLENAVRQDILDQQQLNIAKDSDRALQWIQELRPAMQTATESLLRARKHADDVAQIEVASEQAQQRQDEMASALETMARHFSLIEQGLIASSPETNAKIEESRAQFESPSQSNRQPLESYERADRLSDMARQDPEALLQELERELDRNEPMQRELSELSQQASADAIAQLKNAAKEEMLLAREIENADLAQRGAKELQTQQLRHLADETERMAISLLEKSSQVVQRLNLPETRKTLNQIAENLKSTAREARNADAFQPAEELDNKLQSLLQRIDESQTKLDEIIPTVERRINQPIAKEESQRQSQLTEMKSWQSLMRDDFVRRAKDQARELQQASEQSDKIAEQKNQALQHHMQARKKLMDEYQSHPERTDIQDQLDRNTLENAIKSAEAENAKRLAVSAQNLAEKSADRARRVESASRANLDHPNPIASLAQEQISAAAKELKSVQQALQAITKHDLGTRDPLPNAQALSQASERQNQIARTVDQLAEQLARSARHEDRLKNSDATAMLAEQARAIKQAGSQQIAQAQQELTQASELANEAEQENARQSRYAMPPRAATPPRATAARDRTEQAAESLSQLAKTLEQTRAPKSKRGAEHERGDPMAKEMARLLDSLDQQLLGPNESRSGIGKGDAKQTSQPQQAALRESAGQVAAQLQRERLAKQRERSENSSDPREASAKASGRATEDSSRSENANVGESRLPAVVATPGKEWGRLRDQRAEDVAPGKRESLDPEYSDAIRAYFRVLGERGKELPD